MKRYMIYLPLDVPGRLIRCGDDGSLTLSEMKALVLAESRDDRPAQPGKSA